VDRLTELMPRAPRTDRLAAYEARYRELASELADIGMIHSGSVARRFTRCGTPSCRCHNDPAQRHGPYYQWTTKVANKTVTRRLSEEEAKIYQQWIANDRKLRKLVTQMRQVAAKALELRLEAAR
jgi:hypothetical protein